MAATLLLSSKDRTAGSIEDGEYALQENLLGTYEISLFQMTNNIYNVVSGENDSVYLTHSVDGVQTVLLSPGSYDGSEIATELKLKLDGIGGVTYTVSHSATTGKLTITPASGTVSFTFGTNTAASARRVLGFAEADTLSLASIVSDFPLDLKLHDVIAVAILQDNLANVTLPSSREASFLVPLDNASFGDRLIYRRSQNFSQYVRFSNSISRLNVQLYALDGDLIDVNGAEWVLALTKFSA